MIEIILTIIIIALFLLLMWKEWQGRLERNKLINAILAKNATEMANLELVDKTQIKAEVPKQSDYISPDTLNQKDWEEAIKQ